MSTNCEFETTPLPDGLFRHVCRNCQIDLVRRSANHHRECGTPGAWSPPLPPLFKRITHFAPAFMTHLRHGFPKCTQEQIDSRLEICKACPGDAQQPRGYWLQDPENPNLGACTNCGCSSGREEKFFNMLAWPDQGCPIGAWPKVAV